MTLCECIAHCHFHADKNIMKDLGTARQMITETFCHQDSSECAIYRAISLLGEEKVPKDLCPNQDYRLEGLVQGMEG